MGSSSPQALRARWRRRLFGLWITGSVLIAVYVGIAGPFTTYFGEAMPVVALSLPAFMVFLLATGFGWLVLLVASDVHCKHEKRQAKVGADAPVPRRDASGWQHERDSSERGTRRNRAR